MTLIRPNTKRLKAKSTFLDAVDIEDQIFLAVVGGRIFFPLPICESDPFSDNDDDGRFWLAVALEEPQRPQTNTFEVAYLATYPADHPSFQKVSSHLAFTLFTTPKISQIYVEHESTRKIRAESVLMIGVRLSRMTEPEDPEEWWVLSHNMRRSIEARRKAWEKDSNFVPTSLRPLKSKPKAIKPVAPTKPPVSFPASEVGNFLTTK